MNLIQMIGVLLGIFAVLLLILAYGEATGNSYESVASGVAPLILLIAVFAISASVAVSYIRR